MQNIIDFVRNVGIEVEETTLDENTFLPGILIRDGKMIVDREKLLYPGDLLHEAGHLATLTPEDRKAAGNNVGEDKSQDQATAEEMMAVAWSYAALVHLQLPADVVFHDGGYKGASQWFIQQFASGNYMGLPMLQWVGMCYDHNNAPAHNTEPYPHMAKWLRD